MDGEISSQLENEKVFLGDEFIFDLYVSTKLLTNLLIKSVTFK
jgi:hypothetical protein